MKLVITAAALLFAFSLVFTYLNRPAKARDFSKLDATTQEIKQLLKQEFEAHHGGGQ
jgi:hypothetical protein